MSSVMSGGSGTSVVLGTLVVRGGREERFSSVSGRLERVSFSISVFAASTCSRWSSCVLLECLTGCVVQGKQTGARAFRSACVRWDFVLPSGFNSLVVSVLCKAANLGLAFTVAVSIGGIIIVSLVVFTFVARSSLAG